MNENERKVAVGVRLSLLVEAQNEGYADINEYIDALKQQITKLQNVRELIQNELQKVNLEKEQLEAKFKECENANKKEV
jgi:hypothetical protein